MDAGQILGSIIAGVAIGGISGGLAAWVAFRIKFERFVAMDEQREEDWVTWRQSTVDKRFDAHAEHLARLETRVTRLERNGH